NQNEQIIAAHIKDDVTDEEMKEIVNFIEYIKSKRNTNSNSDKFK
ncbi:transcriptional regulator, partial [Staphylococcus aureus]|nr:transcriptional regulator [Staphylococcus aureus]